jgi:hypothetical protein
MMIVLAEEETGIGPRQGNFGFEATLVLVRNNVSVLYLR